MTSEKGYQFLNLFVYEGNSYFKEYEVEMPDQTSIKANYYMISFMDIFKIECKFIENSKKYPLETKLLQLSVDTRKELVEKLAAYYRLPDEDMEG